MLIHLDQVVRHRCHRLLAEDWLAVLSGDLAHGRVELRGRAHHHSIDRRVLARLRDVGGVHCAAILGAECLGAVAHHVDDVDEARASVAQDGTDVHFCDAACAGDADADKALLAGRQVLDSSLSRAHRHELSVGLLGDNHSRSRRHLGARIVPHLARAHRAMYEARLHGCEDTNRGRGGSDGCSGRDGHGHVHDECKRRRGAVRGWPLGWQLDR
mmetsp:Transcript_20851/g.53782  ORF Transcript_20851/g.53782 Transcript_20851/m.53782 type:complete len:214 (-) Transcript_20851:117-758(-)